MKPESSYGEKLNQIICDALRRNIAEASQKHEIITFLYRKIKEEKRSNYGEDKSSSDHGAGDSEDS